MSEFQPKDYWKVYLNKEAKERIREIQDHLEDNYDGKSDFVQCKIKEEEPITLEERIKQAEEKKQKEEERLRRLKQVKKERETQQTLQDKKELLREKQDRLEEVVEQGIVTREEAEAQTLQMLQSRDKGFWKDASEEEIRDTPAFDRQVEKRVTDLEEIKELQQDVERLQEEVADLNGGREEWFLDLQSVEVKA